MKKNNKFLIVTTDIYNNIEMKKIKKEIRKN